MFGSESAKSSASRACVLWMLACFGCLRALDACVLTCFRALDACVLT